MAIDDIFLAVMSFYSDDVIEEEDLLLLVIYCKYTRFWLCPVNEDE